MAFAIGESTGGEFRRISHMDDKGHLHYFPSEEGQMKHGHPDFYKLCEEIADLHSRKNKDYAQGGDPLGNFRREAAIKSLYPGFPWDSPVGVAMSNMLKQWDCAMWMQAKGYEGEVEGFRERMRDVAVYALIAIILNSGVD